MLYIYCSLMAYLFLLFMISFIFNEFDCDIHVVCKFFHSTSLQDFLNDLNIIDCFVLLLFAPVFLIILLLKLLYRFYEFLESVHPFAKTFKLDNKGGDEFGK